MALSPLKQCSRPGCRAYTRDRSGRCPAHPKEPRARSKQSQEAQKLYDWRWQQASAAYRLEHPLCVTCEAAGRVTASQCVDHVVPHRGNYELFWDQSNWAALCNDCHRTKTAKGR